MFDQMRKLNFDVQLLTTIGLQEKCIDISLAVDMLHYATVPGAYDIAVLLSGDKDFMPAMLRTREKGKRVALCSLKNSCNKHLILHESRTLDFDVIWLDDFSDMLFEKDLSKENYGKGSPISEDILVELVAGLVEKNGSSVTARKLGRMLQKLKAGKSNILMIIKEHFGSLRRFLMDYSDTFICSLLRQEKDDGVDFMVALKDEQLIMAQMAKLGESDENTLKYDELDKDLNEVEPLPDDLTILKVDELKELLKERSLPTKGKKAQLIERLLIDSSTKLTVPDPTESSVSGQETNSIENSPIHNEVQPVDKKETVKGGELDQRFQTALSKIEGILDKGQPKKVFPRSKNEDETLSKMIFSYLKDKEKGENIRDLGRFLNKLAWPDSSKEKFQSKNTALEYLKSRNGSLMNYMNKSEIFKVEFDGEGACHCHLKAN